MKRKERLPFLISIPHGGPRVPEEIAEDVCITPRDLFFDSDAFTWEIFNADDLVHHQLSAEVARAFVDLNRPTNQLPPRYPDGVIKSETCWGKPVYKPRRAPDEKKIAMLLRRYYFPYHEAIRTALAYPGIRLAIDCHSMAETAPPTAPDKGGGRPLVNLGDLSGKACDPAITNLLRDSFIKVLGCSLSEVLINFPFKGGYITRTYGNNPLPWIQVELNRSLYLADEWFDREKLSVNPERLEELNRQFRDVLTDFSRKIID